MIPEEHKLRMCAEIQKRMPKSPADYLLGPLNPGPEDVLVTACPWKDDLEYLWEFVFYLVLANGGSPDWRTYPMTPTRCQCHPWPTGLVHEEVVTFAHIMGYLAGLTEDREGDYAAFLSLLTEYRTLLMEFHDEVKAAVELEHSEKTDYPRIRIQSGIIKSLDDLKNFLSGRFGEDQDDE